MKRWWTYAERAAARAGYAPEYLFVGDPINDRDTWEVIEELEKRSVVHDVVIAESRGVDKREWDWVRYERMADLRNWMLERVRDLAPDYFLSLDSDILIHEDAIANMVESLDRFENWAAIGAKAHLADLRLEADGTPRDAQNTHAPNYANLARTGMLRRDDNIAVLPCDVLMAIKLMTPAAYHVDYKVDMQGEDIGWSKNCHAANLALGFDGRVCSKHVMQPDRLDVVDPRCGY